MKYLFSFALIISTLALYAQNGTFYQQEAAQKPEKTKCLTLGVLQGGGSLLGADFEVLISKQVGMQVGMGLVGFGGGINYHFKPSVRSSFLSLQYWHQGYADSYAQSVAGANYVYRGKKWFTFQIGLGVPLEIGPAMPEDYQVPPVMLMYSLGAYIPL